MNSEKEKKTAKRTWCTISKTQQHSTLQRADVLIAGQPKEIAGQPKEIAGQPKEIVNFRTTANCADQYSSECFFESKNKFCISRTAFFEVLSFKATLTQVPLAEETGGGVAAVLQSAKCIIIARDY